MMKNAVSPSPSLYKQNVLEENIRKISGTWKEADGRSEWSYRAQVTIT